MKKIYKTLLMGAALVFINTIFVFALTGFGPGNGYPVNNPVDSNEELWGFKPGETISASKTNGNNYVLLQRIKELEKSQVPSKAVMAFYRTCPSNWVPADGENGTPDLRGVFVRGLNNFEKNPEGEGTGVARSDGNQDPDGTDRVLSGYQPDLLKKHSHNVTTFSGLVNGGYGGHGSGTLAHVNAAYTTTETGGVETRPKNVALIYCMKK